MSPEFAAYEAQSFEAFQKAGGDVSHIKFYEGAKVREKTRVKDAITAYEWPAGSSHPAKLAQWLLNTAIERGVTLFTHCPVSQVSKSSEANDDLWDVQTPRGIITAPTIIHCTNAYASLLLPQLQPYLTPNRAQAHSIVAPPAFSGSNILANTFSLRYGLHHFYSLIQRRSDGTLILGVSRSNPNLSTEALRSRPTFDDRTYNEEILEDALKQWKILFPGEEEDITTNDVHGQGLDHVWTGIIGMTGDFVPFVGRVDGKEGQWVCAGFGGHGNYSSILHNVSLENWVEVADYCVGMARVFTCAPGLIKMILGEAWSETGLPECFQMSKARLSRLEARAKS